MYTDIILSPSDSLLGGGGQGGRYGKGNESHCPHLPQPSKEQSEDLKATVPGPFPQQICHHARSLVSNLSTGLMESWREK